MWDSDRMACAFLVRFRFLNVNDEAFWRPFQVADRQGGYFAPAECRGKAEQQYRAIAHRSGADHASDGLRSRGSLLLDRNPYPPAYATKDCPDRLGGGLRRRASQPMRICYCGGSPLNCGNLEAVIGHLCEVDGDSLSARGQS